MATTWRTGGLFAAGLLVGVAVGGWAVIQAHNRAVWQDNGPTRAMGNATVAAPAPEPAPAPAVASMQPVPAPAQVMAAVTPGVPATVAAQSCDDTAIVPPGRGDGQQSLQPAPSVASASEVAALLLTGKEAAASGHMRDAEIVFLNACRDARVVPGKEAAVTLADAMYQLGRHYATVAQANTFRRGELLARSQRLYQAALQAYELRYGAKGEKTRFAQQGLATVARLAGGATLPSAPAVAQVPGAAPVRTPVAKGSAREEAAKLRAAAAMASEKPAKPQAATPAPAQTAAARHDAASQAAASVQARDVPDGPKPPAVVHAAPTARDESSAASASPQRARPAPPAQSDSAKVSPDPASEPRSHPAPREPARPSLAEGSDSPGAHANADRAPPVTDSRPPAPAREEVRRAPRSEDSAGEDAPVASHPTASGSAGDTDDDSH
ncbi:hypothetical protein [Ramlibacter sp.]|uniref:hypothetical protein n=1 Tax=Ramlibacter sp. TaxID=1917967 RepID=UPI0026317BC5|nr:hypothetical protein [Ramlibacter sp.]MDB5957012.1 hypothetical protein [Ramlibacter sp.]